MAPARHGKRPTVSRDAPPSSNATVNLINLLVKQSIAQRGAGGGADQAGRRRGLCRAPGRARCRRQGGRRRKDGGGRGRRGLAARHQARHLRSRDRQASSCARRSEHEVMDEGEEGEAGPRRARIRNGCSASDFTATCGRATRATSSPRATTRFGGQLQCHQHRQPVRCRATLPTPILSGRPITPTRTAIASACARGSGWTPICSKASTAGLEDRHRRQQFAGVVQPDPGRLGRQFQQICGLARPRLHQVPYLGRSDASAPADSTIRSSPTDLVYHRDLGFDGFAIQVKQEVTPGLHAVLCLRARFPVFNTASRRWPERPILPARQVSQPRQMDVRCAVGGIVRRF